MGDPGGDSLRIAICEDHRILSDALALLFDAEPGLSLVAPPVATGEEAVELCKRDELDVVLVDITLAGQIDGIEATAQIKRFAPDVQVVILSGMDLDQYLVAAIEAGASGFITKGADLDHVIGQIRAAARGEMLIDPARLAKLMRSSAAQRGSIRDRDSTLGRLTAREQEVLSLMAEGHRNEQIAVDLTISPHTVQSHVKNILSKLGAHSRLEAVARAAKTGALSPKD